MKGLLAAILFFLSLINFAVQWNRYKRLAALLEAQKPIIQNAEIILHDGGLANNLTINNGCIKTSAESRVGVIATTIAGPLPAYCEAVFVVSHGGHLHFY